MILFNRGVYHEALFYMKSKIKAVALLRNPMFLLLSICLGVFIGFYYPNFSKSIKIFGDVYIKLLMLTIFPLIITAIVSSVARLVHFDKLKKVLPRIFLWFILILLVCSSIGVLAGVIGKPGIHLSDIQKSNLLELSKSSELNFSTGADSNKLFSSLKTIVPSNIFLSLTSGNILQVMLFSVLLGLSIGLINRKNSDYLLDIFEGLYSAMQNIIGWISLILPFALFCLISNLTVNIGLPLIGPMFRFIIIFYIIGVFILILGSIVIWYKSGQKFVLVLNSLLDPILVSISTQNSLAALPSAVNSMVKGLKFEKESSNLFLPLGQFIGQYGNIIFFSLATLFITQFYSINLSPSYILLIIISSVLAGITSGSYSGFTILPLLTLILTPLRIPTDTILFIFISIDLIINPMRTLLTVFVNLVATSLIVKTKPQEVSQQSPGVILQNIPENIDLYNYFAEFEEEIPIISLNRSDFLISVFPNASFKKYKSWKAIDEKWSSFDVNIVVGDKDHLKEILNDNLGESKLVVLNKRK